MVSAGILVVGGPGWSAVFGGSAPDGNPYQYSTGIQIVKNILENNDVGVLLESVKDAAFNAADVATNIKVVNNDISNVVVTNGLGYQVGVADIGNNDKIITNRISGDGIVIAVDADTSFTNRPKVHATK